MKVAIASLTIGAVVILPSVLGAINGGFGFGSLAGITGLIMGIIALKRDHKPKTATSGIVLNSLIIILDIIGMSVFCSWW